MLFLFSHMEGPVSQSKVLPLASSFRPETIRNARAEAGQAGVGGYPWGRCKVVRFAQTLLQLYPGHSLLQARSYEEASSSVLGWYLRNAQTSGLSHPLPVLRAREIDRWGQGPEFKALLARNRVPSTVSAQQQQLRSLGGFQNSVVSASLRQPLRKEL